MVCIMFLHLPGDGQAMASCIPKGQELLRGSMKDSSKPGQIHVILLPTACTLFIYTLLYGMA